VLGPELEGPGNQVNQNGWVKQGIGVIGHQKDRAFCGDGFRPLYLDGAVVHPKGDAEKSFNEQTHPLLGGGHAKSNDLNNESQYVGDEYK